MASESKIQEVEDKAKEIYAKGDAIYDKGRKKLNALRDDKKTITLPRVVWYVVGALVLVGMIYVFSCRKPATDSNAVPDKAQAEQNVKNTPPPPPNLK
jgi:hypothetical protein